MTSLEHIGDGSVADRNFKKLMGLMLDTGGQSVGIRFGTNTVAFTTGNKNTADQTISHGLGRTPVAVICTPTLANTAAAGYQVMVTTVGATSFNAWGWAIDATPGANFNISFYWVVIG